MASTSKKQKIEIVQTDSVLPVAAKELDLSDKRRLAQQVSALSRRANIQNRMADRLELILKATTDADVTDASFKDKMVAAGILYDKLYRDNHATPSNAIQINIKTIGVPEANLEPLLIDITPKVLPDVPTV